MLFAEKVGMMQVDKCYCEQKIRKKNFSELFLCDDFFIISFFQTWPYLLKKNRQISLVLSIDN